MLTEIDVHYVFFLARQIQYTRNVPQCVLQTEYIMLAHLASGINLGHLKGAVISIFAYPLVAGIRS